MIHSEKEYKVVDETVKALQKEMKDFRERQSIKHRQEAKERHRDCKGHEFEYTNAKWQPVNQRRCIHCGYTTS